jgi:hypothetical protein
MSTKTTIKRIALVAAVAAAFGGLSTVAANASSTESGATLLSGSLVSSNPSSATAGTQVVGGIATVVLTETNTAGTTGDTLGTLTSTGVGSITSVAASTNVSAATSTTFPTTSVAIVSRTGTASVGEAVTVSLSSAVAGAQTITFTPITANGAPGTAITATITWGAAPVVSAQYSTVSEYAGATASGTAVTTTSASSSISTTAVAAVAVTTMASSTVAMPTDTVLATISGPGSLGGNTTNTAVASQGRSISVTAASAGHTYFYVYPDGTAGTSTITFTDGTVVLGTATVVFVGSPTKATATQSLFIAPAGAILGQVATQYATTGAVVGNGTTPTSTITATGTYAVTIYATDANGNAASFSGWTPTITNSNSAVVSGNSCVADSSNAGYYYCSVSGANAAVDGSSATVTWTWTNTAGTTVISTSPVKFTIGGAIAKVAIATDADSYSALAPLAIVASATDSKGNAAYDQDAALFTSTGLTASTQLGGSELPVNTTVALISGQHTFKGFYAPTVAGSFTITGTDNTTAANVVSATASSVGGSADTQAAAATDAANEATDAANAATDAANAAADAADAATAAAQDAGAKADAALAAVTALSAKITVLAAQIAKIVKKLKA